MRLIDADALNYKNLAEVNGRLTYVLTAEEIDNAPTVKPCENCEEKKKLDYLCHFSSYRELQALRKFKEEHESPQDDIFPMEIVAGKCPIEANGNCPLKPQGEWLKNANEIYKCSLCGAYGNPNYFRFCPNCGAKMGGAE